MLYTSEVTGKSYKTVKELEADEKAYQEAQSLKLKACEEKKARAKEVEDAYLEFQKVKEEAYDSITKAENKWISLRDAFAKDYGGYHMTYTHNNGEKRITFEDLIHNFWNF